MKLKRIDVIIVVITIISVFIVANLPFKAKPFGDLTFHQEAKNLTLFIKGAINYDQVTITKAPGPVIFYTIPYLFIPEYSTENTYWYAGIIFTNILLTIGLLLTYRTSKYFFNSKTALLTILLFFLFPIHLYYSLGILAEGPAFFSLCLALYGWKELCKENKKGFYVFTIGILLLILNRPNTLLFIPASGIILSYFYFKKKITYQKLKLYCKSLLIISILGLVSLQVSKRITNNKTDKSQEQLFYFVAHQGRFQFREEPLDFRFWEGDIRGKDSKDYQNWVKNSQRLKHEITSGQKSYNQAYKDFLIQDLIDHPFLYIRQFFVKCFYGHIYIINSIKKDNFSLLFLKNAWGYNIFILLINTINILIIIGVFIFIIKQNNLKHYWPFWTIIVSVLIFHGLTYMEPRYLFPSKAALLVLSAAGLMYIKKIDSLVSKMDSYLN